MSLDTVTRPAAANAVVWRWDLEGRAFGDHAPQTDPDGDLEHFTLNLRFPGQYFDAESGLHYNYFRDYEPETGRYAESDPIGLSGGISTYSYVSNAPTNASDRSGLCECPGGVWSEEGWFNLGASAAWGGIYTVGRATYRCDSKPDVVATLTVSCVGGGLIGAIGIGLDIAPLGQVFGTPSCASFSDWTWNFYLTIGPFSGTGGITNGGGSSSVGRSIGVGGALIRCRGSNIVCSCCDETSFY